MKRTKKGRKARKTSKPLTKEKSGTPTSIGSVSLNQEVPIMVTNHSPKTYTKEQIETIRKQFEMVLKRMNSAQREVVSFHHDWEFMKNPVAPKIGELLLKNSTELGEEFVADFHNAVKTGNYTYYAFCSHVETEVRFRHLALLEEGDTAPKLLSELAKLLLKVASSEDVQILMKAIKDAEERFKNTYRLEPDLTEITPKPSLFEKIMGKKDPEKTEVNVRGIRMALVKQHEEKYPLEVSRKFIKVPENHDLLSLKALVETLKGRPIQGINLGFGFFTKYMPEIHKAGYGAVTILADRNSIQKIYLQKWHKEAPDMYYSPLESAIYLGAYYAKQIKVPLSAISDDPRKMAKVAKENTRLRLDTMLPSMFPHEDVKHYVTVSGCVAGPDATEFYTGYSGYNFNKNRILSGEVFCFEKIKGVADVVQTRFFFYPYNPQEISVKAQTGTPIMGITDQSYHSCFHPKLPILNDGYSGSLSGFKKTDRGERNNRFELWADSVIRRFKMLWKEEQEKISFSPAVVLSNLHRLAIGKGMRTFPQTDILRPENYDGLKDALHSVSAPNKFSMSEALYNVVHYIPSDWCAGLIAPALIKAYQPLTHRWNLKNYLQDGIGLTYKEQETSFISLCEKIKKENDLAWFVEHTKLNSKK